MNKEPVEEKKQINFNETFDVLNGKIKDHEENIVESKKIIQEESDKVEKARISILDIKYLQERLIKNNPKNYDTYNQNKKP